MEIPQNRTFDLRCLTCNVSFHDNQLHKTHYQSAWHQFNLKRSVANLPVLTFEEFNEKVKQRDLQQQKENQPKETKYCDVCRKSFSNEKAYDNHLQSKKHNDNAKKPVRSRQNTESTEMDVDEDSEVEEVDSDEWEDDTLNPIDNNDCLFCSHHSRNFYKNLEHMTIAHSFFIPDIEYCIDVQGLLRYLGEKVAEYFMCLWCNDRGRTFHSAEAAKSHMVDKGHCKMLHEGLALAEYADYYDYSSSYPDAEGTSKETEEINPDDEVDVPVLNDTEYQLVLPSGITIGHRSLMRYYKQSGNRMVVAVDKSANEERKKLNKLHKVLSQYRAVGWTATQQEAAARKARDLHYLKRMQSKLNVKLGVKGNKLQKHFRQQTNF